MNDIEAERRWWRPAVISSSVYGCVSCGCGRANIRGKILFVDGLFGRDMSARTKKKGIGGCSVLVLSSDGTWTINVND